MDNRLVCFLITSLLLNACAVKQETQKGEKPLIVTTTGMIADAVKNIVDTTAQVSALMGPGVDPHLYKATQGDLSKLTDADLILYNGLHLEGKMAEVLEKLSRQKEVFAIANEVDNSKLYRVPQFNNNYDPHIWFDVELWSQAVARCSEILQQAFPEHADLYRQNSRQYLDELSELNKWVGDQISEIPEEQRVLITAHDAFGYFGRAYNIEVKGLQGISTLSEYGLKDVSDLVDFIISRQIRAVFVETSVSEKAINAVVEGCKKRGFDIEIGGNLYSDAMGQAGTAEGTYTGMVKANVNTIVEALKP